MKRIPMKALCLVSLFLMSAVAMADDSKEDQPKTGFSDRWWLSFEASMFSEGAGLTTRIIPSGIQSYENTFTILTPKFAAGYRFAPKWSVELQMQMGPVESLETFSETKELNRYASVASSFLAASVSREFAMPFGLTLESKVGVARSWFVHDIEVNGIQTRDVTISETRPVASIGIRSQITPRLSGSLEFTNYFLKQTQPVSALAVGLRRSFGHNISSKKPKADQN